MNSPSNSIKKKLNSKNSRTEQERDQALTVSEVHFFFPVFGRDYFEESFAKIESVLNSSAPNIRPIRRSLSCQSDENSEDLPQKTNDILHREFRWLAGLGLSKPLALVVAPTGNPILEELLSEFSNRHCVPIIFFSLDAYDEMTFQKKGLETPPCVITNGGKACYEMGFIAGKNLDAKSCHSIIVIPGDDQRKDSNNRVQEFERGIRKGFKGDRAELTIVRTVPGYWQRRLTAEIITERLRESTRPSVIFAANDNMALGVCDSLQRWGINARSIQVFGFDAIDEVRFRLSDPLEPFLCATVSQNVNFLATQLVALCRELSETPLKGRALVSKQWWTGERCKLVEPRIISRASEIVGPVEKYRLCDAEKWVTSKKAASLLKIGDERLRAFRRNPGYGDGRIVGKDTQGVFGVDVEKRKWRELKLDKNREVTEAKSKKVILYWLPSIQ